MILITYALGKWIHWLLCVVRNGQSQHPQPFPLWFVTYKEPGSKAAFGLQLRQRGVTVAMSEIKSCWNFQCPNRPHCWVVPVPSFWDCTSGWGGTTGCGCSRSVTKLLCCLCPRTAKRRRNVSAARPTAGVTWAERTGSASELPEERWRRSAPGRRTRWVSLFLIYF